MTTRRANSPVSLFPFLAVLVCAMGALIFLLLIATRRIRAEVRAETIDETRRVVAAVETPQIVELPEPEPEPRPASPPPTVVADMPPLPAPELPRVDWDRLLRDLQQRRQQRHTAMEDRSRSLALTQTRQQQADELLQQLRGEQEILERRGADLETRLGPLQERTRTLREDLKELDLEIRQSRRRREAVETRFAFLPFDGVSGTHRRPIFIECHPDRIEFASEKIGLTAAELNGFTIDNNPLLAGTRALVAYWEKRDSITDSDREGGKTPAGQSEKSGTSQAREPYLLIVVRPGGVHAYYIARKLLARLRTPIGYELVADDMPLAWPGRDTRAATVCHEAIGRVLARRSLISRPLGGVGAGNFSGGPGGRNRPGRRRGTLVAENDAGGRGPGKTSPGQNVSRRSSGSATKRPVAGRASRTRTTGSGDAVEGPTGKSVADGSHRVERAPSVRGRRIGTDNRASGKPGREEPGRAEPGRAEPGGAEPGGAEPGGAEPESRRRANGGVAGFDTLTIGQRPRQRVPGQPSRELSNPGGGSGRGRDGSPRYWGVVGLRATIGYERRVRVRVSPERLVVGDERPIEAGLNVPADVVRRKVVAALQRIAQGWGSPPERFYWVPAVRFEVSHGGHLHYQRLDSVFRRWKLPTTVEFLLEPPGDSSSRLLQSLEIPTP